MKIKLEHRTNRRLSSGANCPLGASVQPDGVNFAIYSRKAKQVFLLLFSRDRDAPSDVIELKNQSNHVWYTFVHDIGPGQLYGFKMCGEYDPGHGLYFNENKLLIDPYAKALTGKFINTDNLFLKSFFLANTSNPRSWHHTQRLY